MWYCYTIRPDDNFRQLSVITENLQEIYNFISIVTKTTESFIFEIRKKPIDNYKKI